MRPNQQTRTETLIATSLEQTWHLDLQAINTRNFSRSTNSPLFQQKSLDWGASYDNSSVLDLEAYVRVLSEMAARCPDLEIQASDVRTYVDERAGVAKMFANKEMIGWHEDLVLRSVVEVFWRRGKDGVWVSTGHVAMPGWDCEVSEVN